ncbi:hypothetical protein OG792_34185 [Micromonospora sp. NBC_01699]|uniref:hypothetical protein n=1 Tax=Micromonospora sp. NBC_01699 TaxID=2975984 RepID=UPI002E29E136|nr:hypothetical protein [Micromonospora sp. NBC_01699]
MFGFGRRKSHGQLVRTELGEGFGHFMQAAGHAADGVGATVGPRVQVARSHLSPTATRVAATAANGWESTMTVVAPLAVAALAGARQAGMSAAASGTRNITGSKKKMMKAMPKNKRKSNGSRRRWTLLTGLLAAGAVAGAVGAVAIRRRQQEHWEAYEPLPAPETSRGDGRASAGGGLSSTAGRNGDEAAGTATKPKPVTIEKVRDRTAAAGEKIATTAGTATDGGKPAGKAAAKPDGLLGAGPAGNSRS